MSNFVVSNVIIDGDVKIRDEVKNSLIQPILSSHSLDEAIKTAHGSAAKLVHLGMAKSCKVIVDAKEAGRIHLVLKPEKATTIMAKTGTQIGASEGSMKASFSLKNVLGGGESVEFNASYGMETSIPLTFTDNYQANLGKTFQLQMSTPLGLDPDNYLEATLSNESKDHSFTNSHIETITGGSLVLKLLNRVTGDHLVALNVHSRELGGMKDSTSWSVRRDAGHNLKSCLSYTLTKDERDDPILPTSGYFARLYKELAGAVGHSKHIKYDLDLQKYFTKEGWTLSASLRHGLLYSFTQRSHISDRFFIGGPLSIRGFQPNGLQPSEGNDQLGGDAYWALGTSVMSPLPYVGKNGPVKGHAFLNAGKLISFENFNNPAQGIRDLFQTPSVSAGVGLLIKFSILRAEINYCLPLFVHPGDKLKPGLQFGLGLHFL